MIPMSQVLSMSSSLFGVSAIFQRNIKRKVSMGSMFISSQLYWNGYDKRIDPIVSKLCFSHFLYDTCSKNTITPLYIAILLSMGISWYKSDQYSRKEWLSKHHVKWHALLHIFGFIASLVGSKTPCGR